MGTHELFKYQLYWMPTVLMEYFLVRYFVYSHGGHAELTLVTSCHGDGCDR